MSSIEEKWGEILEEFVSLISDEDIILEDNKENWRKLPNDTVEYYVDMKLHPGNNAGIMHCISTAIHMLDYKYAADSSLPGGYVLNGEKVSDNNLRISFTER